jgi:hypothetical protein
VGRALHNNPILHKKAIIPDLINGIGIPYRWMRQAALLIFVFIVALNVFIVGQAEAVQIGIFPNEVKRDNVRRGESALVVGVGFLAGLLAIALSIRGR